MDFIERVAEKVIPSLMLLTILGLFKMYYDVETLKSIASDYKDRADKLHDEMKVKLETCSRYDIIQNKDIQFLESRLSIWEKDKNQ